MRRRLGILGLGLVLPWLAAADTVELNTGAKIEGTVLGYSNLHFEVSSADLNTTKLAAVNVRRINFVDRGGPATLVTRTGPVTGTLISYQANAFRLLSDGKPQQVQSIFVKNLVMPRLRRSAPGEGDDTEPTDILEIAEALSQGEEIDPKTLLSPGQPTLVFFYGNLGPGVQCRLLNNYLDNIASKQFRVAIRKINIGQWDSPVAQQYKVRAIPRLDIYDSAGRLAHSIEGNRLADITTALKQTR